MFAVFRYVATTQRHVVIAPARVRQANSNQVAERGILNNECAASIQAQGKWRGIRVVQSMSVRTAGTQQVSVRS